MKGWRCPKCGSDLLEVVVTVWGKLYQTLDPDKTDNEFTVDVDDGDKEWGDTSPMTCRQCGYLSIAQDFKWSSGPKGTIPVIAEQEAP